MSSISSNVIENYIQRVTELNQSSQRIPAAEELEKIASELGISPLEIQAAQKQSNDHFVRAQGYMGLEHWDDAIAELQEAVVFNPAHLDMLLCLASAHLSRWQEKHHPDDEHNARLRIKQCLAIRPDSQEALALLFQLSNALKWRKRRLLAVGIIGAATFATAIGSFFLFNNGFVNPFARESKLEALERSVTIELQLLEQRQKQLLEQSLAIERSENRRTQNTIDSAQTTINKLQERVNKLEKEIAALKKLKAEPLQPTQPKPDIVKPSPVKPSGQP